MAYAPSNVLPGTTEAVALTKIARGFVCGMVDDTTGFLEVVQFGDFTEDGLRVGFHYQTGPQRFEGFVATVADLKLCKLTRALASAGAAYRRPRHHSPVPAWCRNSADLAMANCD